MIQVLKVTESGSEVMHEFNVNEALPSKDSWVRVSNPNAEEIRALSEKLAIPADFLTNSLDVDERPRIEIEDHCLLVLIRTPYFDDSDKDVQVKTIPLGIIVTDDFIITVCSRDNEVIQVFSEGRERRGWSTAKRSRFILQIFSRTARAYLQYLSRINRESSAVENRLQESMKNEELIELLGFEKSLVYFTTSLRSNELVMERLQRTDILKMLPDDVDLLEDVIIEIRQAIEMANIYSNILSGMMDAFASVISNNLNIVMKFLTSVTIILMLPTLIGSFYGMNIKLPLQNFPHAFAVLIGLSFTLATTAVVIFVKRRWF